MERRVCGAGDRAVWVLFSPRPLSAALCQRWFIALLVAISIAPLRDAAASCCTVIHPPPPPAGRAFRFTPTDPLNTFLQFPIDHGGVCRPASQRLDSLGAGGDAGALLAAETARLLLDGQDVMGARSAQTEVDKNGSLVLTLPLGEPEVAVNGLACEALRYTGAAVALKVHSASAAIHIRHRPHTHLKFCTLFT
jgi:hypothetical protein